MSIEGFVVEKYDDSKEGVISCLREESTFVLPASDLDIDAEYDPYVQGVWKVGLDPEKNGGDSVVIVYLAGFRDPLGETREFNDWEAGEA